MTHLIATLHLLGLHWQDRLASTLDAGGKRSERGSITIEQVAWAVGIIAIVAIAVAAIRTYVTTQVGRL